MQAGDRELRGRLLGGLTRNVFLLGLVSLCTDLGSQMGFPLLPLFLTSVLGAGAFTVGIVEGAAETTASLLKIVSGFRSDRVRRRKPFILFGYSLSSLMKSLFAFAGSWPFVLFVRVAERIGKGVRNAPRDAIVAESCDEQVRGKAYGFHRAMDGISGTPSCFSGRRTSDWPTNGRSCCTRYSTSLTRFSSFRRVCSPTGSDGDRSSGQGAHFSRSSRRPSSSFRARLAFSCSSFYTVFCTV